jgi:hypothetical protein
MEKKFKRSARIVPRWSQLRAVGELRILNQISYVGLFLVPLIAGVWPAVRSVLGQFDSTVRYLPSSLALGFFASASTVVAQTVYHAAAPYFTRAYSRSGYIRHKIDEYKNNPSEANLRSFVHHVERTARGPGFIVAGGHESPYSTLAHVSKEGALEGQIDIIARYAAIYYDFLANERLGPRIVSSVFYLVSGFAYSVCIFSSGVCRGT